MLELVPYFGILAQNLEFGVKFLNFSPSVCFLAMKMSKSCLCKGQGRKGGGLGSSGRFRHGCRHGCWIKRFPPHFVWVCVCVYTHICINIYSYMFVCLCVCVCMFVCVCVCRSICRCIYICMHLYRYTYIYLCDTYIHPSRPAYPHSKRAISSSRSIARYRADSK